MIVDTKFQKGDIVYVFNPYTGKIKEREIVGIMYKEVKNTVCILYGFIKDSVQDEKDMFWIPESRVFDNLDDVVE